MGLTGIPLAFSTIQPGDTNPYRGGRGGAEGSVGIIVDIGPATVIHSVGSHLEVRNRYQGHLEDWHLIMSGRISQIRWLCGMGSCLSALRKDVLVTPGADVGVTKQVSQIKCPAAGLLMKLRVLSQMTCQHLSH